MQSQSMLGTSDRLSKASRNPTRILCQELQNVEELLGRREKSYNNGYWKM